MELPYRLHLGDCRQVLKTFPDNSFDSVVTDPPYGLSFMGKRWDYEVPAVSVWAECLRVLKPGGHLLAFAGTRTQHRMAVRIEDAGFEIRDMIAWVYGSGFPKSMDVSKAIDKIRDDSASVLRVTTFMASAADRAGITRAQVDNHMGTSDMAGWWLSRLQHRSQCPKWDQWLKLKAFIGFGDEMDAEVWHLNGRKGQPGNERPDREVTHPGSNTIYQASQKVLNAGQPIHPGAVQWQGWGTALKPALEPITVARKPLVGTVAANVLAHGTGALNIDGCRIPSEPMPPNTGAGGLPRRREDEQRGPGAVSQPHAGGRWPANLIHDGSPEVVALFPHTKSGVMKGGTIRAAQDAPGSVCYGTYGGNATSEDTFGDEGSAARFFYCAKATRRDRNEGCEHMERKPLHWSSGSQNPGSYQSEGTDKTSQNNHPTVKPTDLMAYLVRLVTPPGGKVLDPFTGSGSTGKAAVREGFEFVGIEREAPYLAIAEARIAHELERVTAAAMETAEAEAQLDIFRDAKEQIA
ncbi:DNA methyltransferase [Pseudomonas aeruginosa]|uniref:DNA methyltransferase n=1 Tax=Pseudomonas aeruginosa TaxID=287 RepID=UPI00223759CC|nr:DNA methyltransferase [Pseudomonas aeruginosa]MCW4650997.1 site-specific DNA-methyltransferase [Pseudomonas aeruginosa]